MKHKHRCHKCGENWVECWQDWHDVGKIFCDKCLIKMRNINLSQIEKSKPNV